MTVAVLETTHPNLVTDSALVEQTISYLHRTGGRASVAAIADDVLETPALDEATARFLVEELIADDPRLRLTSDDHLELTIRNVEAQLINETDFVVVDVETTGARTPPNRITEVGAYRVRQGEIVDSFQTLVNPRTPIPPFISSLTGITNEMVRSAPSFAEIAPEWLRFAGSAVLVAHNAAFDMRFLNHELARVFPQRRMGNAHLCSVALARRTLPGLVNYRLHTVAAHFGLTIQNRHRAADDALATAHVLINLLDILRENNVHFIAEARTFRR